MAINPEFNRRNNMGCPSIYYKRALQCFAHALVYMDDSKLAKELLEEKSEDKLEKFILEKKKLVMRNSFIMMPVEQ